MDDTDVWMRQSGNRFGLCPKSLSLILIPGQLGRHHFYSHRTLEFGVFGEIYFSHAAGTQAAHEPIMLNGAADHTRNNMPEMATFKAFMQVIFDRLGQSSQGIVAAPQHFQKFPELSRRMLAGNHESEIALGRSIGIFNK